MLLFQNRLKLFAPIKRQAASVYINWYISIIFKGSPMYFMVQSCSPEATEAWIAMAESRRGGNTCALQDERKNISYQQYWTNFPTIKLSLREFQISLQSLLKPASLFPEWEVRSFPEHQPCQSASLSHFCLHSFVHAQPALCLKKSVKERIIEFYIIYSLHLNTNTGHTKEPLWHGRAYYETCCCCF